MIGSNHHDTHSAPAFAVVADLFARVAIALNGACFARRIWLRPRSTWHNGPSQGGPI